MTFNLDPNDVGFCPKCGIVYVKKIIKPKGSCPACSTNLIID